jgi:DNA polymerase I-like protein with 3'-5' exonuclease and polymerase domains
MIDIVMKLWEAQNDPLHDASSYYAIQDELIFDTPEPIAQDAAREIDRIMCIAGRKVCPNVPLKVDATLMRRWGKKAPSTRAREVGGCL